MCRQLVLKEKPVKGKYIRVNFLLMYLEGTVKVLRFIKYIYEAEVPPPRM